MPLNRNKQFFLLSIVLLAVTIAVVMLGVPGMSPTPLMQARKTALHQDHAAACRLAEYAFQQDPTCVECLVIGAEAAEALSDIPRALEFLDHLPQKFDSSELISAWHHKALLQQKAGQLTSAKTTLQKVIRHVPDDAGSQRRMLRLLSDCGYRSESLQYTHKLLQLRQIRLEELVYLAQNGRGTISEQQLQRLHEENPTDEMPINGLLVLSRSQRNASDCRDLIDIAKERLVNSSTSFMAQRLSYELAAGSAESLLGEIAVELTQLHSEDDVPPDAWLVTAEWARLLSDDPLHRRCLAEALRLDPWNRKAVHAMVVSLRQQQSKSLAEFERLSKQLNRIARLAREISLAPDNLEAMHDIVSALVSIGRIDEAKAWGRKAFALDSSNAWAGELVARQQTSDWLHPALNLKLDTRSIRVALVEADTSRQKSVVSQFCFIDEAKSVRLNFEYDNGRLPDQEGLRMHQWTGGGIGVIDIDNDSWPDAYFTQGGDLDSADAKGRGDALFRNLRGSRFTAIQVEAGIWGCDFGQGVSVGDINNDGFDDLYVANVGENRLLLNQGDGTFSVEPFANPSRTWTTSVAIADVDGDNNPDLYDVNYLRGDNVFSQTCDHEGYERICGPADFAAEPDRLWLSNGDGDFTPAADDALPTGEAGRGMGVIVGRLLGESGNQVYVANDESANQLFSLVDGIRFEDVATAVGVGLDHHGQAQGSMGIAAGDTTGRGTADLFVTNYYGESNALYQQFSRSVFVDSTSAAGLASPGYSQLGFGCQLFDADCDGDLDLVVANGHLDDFTHKGHPFRMKPQLFGNDGTGGFRMASSAGAYFETPALGRAVATVDWDGDGRCDLLVGHLDSPAALLTNETPAEKQTATISLIGTRAARTPVGVAVAMVSAGEKQHRWLTAGDGYQCSNEHVVRLAVEQNAESEVGVGWPSNSSDRIERIKPGRWTILEGRGRAYSVPR